MNMKCARAVSLTALLATALVRPAAAQSANALLRDTNRQDVGTVSLLQTPAGVCSSSRSRECLRASMPSIFMPWASASCPRSIRRVRISIRATPITASCWARPGDLPNLHIPPNGALELELINAAITIDIAKPNSVFHPDGTAVVIHGTT
jgi:Cu-Zn family superoxide dismutase